MDAPLGESAYFIDDVQQSFSIEDKQYREQHITLKDNKRVELSAEDLARYEREKVEIQGFLNTYTRAKPLALNLLKPTSGRYSSEFGLKRFFNEQPRSPHSGIDIAAKEGSAIKSAMAGKVIGIGDYFFNGKSVFIDHGQGIITMYCHMSEIAVTVGQTLKKGEVIGKVGATGRATGAHLHFGLNISGKWIDPQLFITTS